MFYPHLKRGLDVLAAGVLLAATLPLWLITAVALLLCQGRPLLYRQQRAGKDGRPFTLLKFRTMRAGPPPRLPDLPVAKEPDDPRVTPFGAVLRRLAIDELPQLLNVLRGEMSLVGPRPLPIDDLAQPGWLAEVDATEAARRRDWLARRHQVRPGLTGLWQITANAAEDFDNWITCDLAYVARPSVVLDLAIVCRTPWAILRGRKEACRPGVERQAHRV